MAHPPEQPMESMEAVDEPMGANEDRPALSNHLDVSLTTMGVIDRLMDAAEAINELQHGEPMEVQQQIGVMEPQQAATQEVATTKVATEEGATEQVPPVAGIREEVVTKVINLDSPPRAIPTQGKKAPLLINYVLEGLITYSL
ncbi:unnamed protein product [Calypogeia fissa]